MTCGCSTELELTATGLTHRPRLVIQNKLNGCTISLATRTLSVDGLAGVSPAPAPLVMADFGRTRAGEAKAGESSSSNEFVVEVELLWRWFGRRSAGEGGYSDASD